MLRDLSKLGIALSQSELSEIAVQADEADKLELYWVDKFTEFLNNVTAQCINQLFNGRQVRERDFDFEMLIVMQMYMVQKKGLASAARLASGPPKAAKPARTIFDLMDEWKKWRRKKNIPKRQRAIAKKMKKEYFDNLHTVWQKHTKGWQAGDVVDQQDIILNIQKDLKKSYANAKTVARTETTLHYNHARKAFYDTNPDITHYLFLAIRDHRTTKWCSTRTGLVYEKGSEYLRKETPPCHWNCRSEIVPLSILNPEHRALILKFSIQRKNRKPAPLPKNWNSRTA